MTDRAKPMNNAGEPAKNIPLTRVDDRAKEVEAIDKILDDFASAVMLYQQAINQGGGAPQDYLNRHYGYASSAMCDLIRRAEVEAFEKLDEYLYSDQGVTDIELVQEYVTERLKELRGEK